MSRPDGCRRERARLLLWLDDELELTEREGFEAHARGCAACGAAVAGHLDVERRLHLLAGVEPDAGFEARMVAGVRRRLADRPSQHPLWLRRAIAAALLALAITGAALVVRSAHEEEVVEPEAVPIPLVAEEPVAPVPAVALAVVPGDVEVDPASLERARARLREGLLSDAGLTRTWEALRAEGWPVEGLLVAVLDEDDPRLVNAGLRAAAELRVQAAVGAARRAVRRPEVAREALVALARLDGADAARLLVDAALAPALRDTAVAELALVGLPALIEVLSLGAEGDDVLAALVDAGLPTAEQATALLASDDERQRAFGVAHAARAGAAGLPALVGAASDPDLAFDAVQAIGQIGGSGALLALCELVPATPADSLLREWLGSAARQVIDAAGGEDLVLRIARGDQAVPLMQLLAVEPPGTEGSQRRERQWGWLRAVVVDPQTAPDVRADAALALLAGRFPVADDVRSKGMAEVLAAASELRQAAPAAAARMVVAAVLGGADEEDVGAAVALRGRPADDLFARAAVVAARVRSDGLPPQPWEEKRLIRSFGGARRLADVHEQRSSR